jgi:hypothetical protein
MKKVDDVPESNAIQEIAHDTPEHQPQREPMRSCIPQERATGKTEQQQYDSRETRQQNILILQYAPCRTGIAHVGDMKKPRDDNDLLPEIDLGLNQKLGHLIENRDRYTGA